MLPEHTAITLYIQKHLKHIKAIESGTATQNIVAIILNEPYRAVFCPLFLPLAVCLTRLSQIPCLSNSCLFLHFVLPVPSSGMLTWDWPPQLLTPLDLINSSLNAHLQRISPLHRKTHLRKSFTSSWLLKAWLDGHWLTRGIVSSLFRWLESQGIRLALRETTEPYSQLYVQLQTTCYACLKVNVT